MLAFDFGASSGRAILGEYSNKLLNYKEIHRFDNEIKEIDGNYYWDFEHIMNEIYCAIEKAGAVDSLAFDTWGVDYGLVGEDGKLCSLPRAYRDVRTHGLANKSESTISHEELYSKTGTQIMDINTLFQLISEEDLSNKTLLFMPDLFAYELCKNKVCEKTISSTSQILNPVTGDWSDLVLDKFEIPKKLFPKVIDSGTVIGEYKGIKVISTAGHDTQCAIAATPSLNQNIAFLSCGTWSLFGTELDKPILTKESLDLAFSNELGANGKVNYLKNITGLWLIQECRKQWRDENGKKYSYDALEIMANNSESFKSFIDVDDEDFATPGDMPKKIQDYCRRTGQLVPENMGELICCIYEGLALKYRHSLEQLKAICGKKIEVLHILGGGSKDPFLCQLTANSCNMPVFAGPAEATALGNIVIQLVAQNAIKDINEGRRLIMNSEKIVNFEPKETEAWESAYQKYKAVLGL